MAKISCIKDLPDWFKLEKYSQCDSFNATDWAGNLNARAVALGYVSTRCSSDDRQNYPPRILLGFAENYELRMLEDMRRLPNYLIPSSRSGYESPVRSLTHVDIAIAARLAINGGSQRDNELWRRTMAAVNETDWPHEPSDYSILDTALRTLGHDLTVDLRANDSVLIKAFTTWLKNARSQMQIASNRERPAYKDWSRYGLLPYLDLLIWSKETARLIPHRVMAEAVDYRKGGDSFRKTVPPIAKKLMIAGGLAELEALAAIEASTEQLIP